MADLVHVIFIDADSGVAFAETEVSPDRLPASFAVSTTIHLGDDEWSVVRADPVTSEEFTRTGELRLEMRLVVQVDPQQILYSLPTISDELPACELVEAPDALVLHEDDWRQVEFVADVCKPEVEECLGRIESILRDHRQGSGAFDEIHVRREVPEPMRGVELRLEDLRSAFTGLGKDAGVTISGNGRVIDGFELHLPSGACLYGLAPAGRVRVLGIVLTEKIGDAGPDAEALAALMETHGLRLVDWCTTEVFSGNQDALATYLRGGSSL